MVPGSDWSVVPSVNPWIGIETLVTSEKPGGSPETLGKGEAILLSEAIGFVHYQLGNPRSERGQGRPH